MSAEPLKVARVCPGCHRRSIAPAFDVFSLRFQRTIYEWRCRHCNLKRPIRLTRNEIAARPTPKLY
jgi:hypothetical protein